jgi:hypothetical protein
VNPASVTGGASSTGTVTLNGAAPAGGAMVTLSASNKTVAKGNHATFGQAALVLNAYESGRHGPKKDGFEIPIVELLHWYSDAEYLKLARGTRRLFGNVDDQGLVAFVRS